MNRIKDISLENPYIDDIEGFEKLVITEETCPEEED